MTGTRAFWRYSAALTWSLIHVNIARIFFSRYFTWVVAAAYLTSLMLFRKPLSDETLHQLSLKDSRQLSDLNEDRALATDPPTRFGVLSRWLRGSQIPTQLHTAGGDQRQRSPSAEIEIKASVDEAYSVSAFNREMILNRKKR